MSAGGSSPPSRRRRPTPAVHQRRRLVAVGVVVALIVAVVLAVRGGGGLSLQEVVRAQREAQPVRFTIEASGDLLIHSLVWERALALGGDRLRLRSAVR